MGFAILFEREALGRKPLTVGVGERFIAGQRVQTAADSAHDLIAESERKALPDGSRHTRRLAQTIRVFPFVSDRMVPMNCSSLSATGASCIARTCWSQFGAAGRQLWSISHRISLLVVVV